MASNRLGRSGEGDRGRRGHSPAWRPRRMVWIALAKKDTRVACKRVTSPPVARRERGQCGIAAALPLGRPRKRRRLRRGALALELGERHRRAAATPPSPPLFTP
jgi:hypothetical protein